MLEPCLELEYLGFAETEVRRDHRGTFSAGTEVHNQDELYGLKIVQSTPSKHLAARSPA
jgi:hypothetical protein